MAGRTPAATVLAGLSTIEQGHRCIHHDGSWQGFETAIDRYVDDQLTVVVLTNLADAEPGKITPACRGNVSGGEVGKWLFPADRGARFHLHPHAVLWDEA